MLNRHSDTQLQKGFKCNYMSPSHDSKVKNNVYLSINLSNNEMDKLIRFLSFVLNGLVNYFVEFIFYHAHSGGITKTS